jgi:hypothetical protein
MAAHHPLQLVLMHALIDGALITVEVRDQQLFFGVGDLVLASWGVM